MHSPTLTHLIFPHQLFAEHFSYDPKTLFIFIEDDLFFREFTFHKQKLILHRASMQFHYKRLQNAGFEVEYIETSTSQTSMDRLAELLTHKTIKNIHYHDLVDDWLQQRLDAVCEKYTLTAERSPSPAFLTTRGEIDDYFDRQPNRMQHFYEWQRRRLSILMDKNGTPVGGKWSFDEANRKKLPASIQLPKQYDDEPSADRDDAIAWVRRHFAENPGNGDSFHYPITHDGAVRRLHSFLSERFELFGPYEDAITTQGGELFHSVLSPLINNGLLTPRQVIDEALAYAETHTIPIESLEGFIRQIIGWREYMRATYVKFGRKMRMKNHLSATHSLDKSWWDGTTGLDPIDDTIKRVLDTGYAHHIERLMILGNSMVLLRISPDEVYTWFMTLFIDAYDWVMVPNVYAMSQFAAADFITTKPYISGSNYIIKMSDYKKGAWSEIWDALYWRFIDDFREMIAANPRSSMMVSLYDRMNDEKKDTVKTVSQKWLS